MADERFYEQKVTNALAEAYVAADNARKFISAVQKMHGAKAAVCLRISQLIHISTSDAEAYINMDNGKFKPGRYMSYCLDTQLKQAFASLESAMTEFDKYHFSTQTEANNIATQKLNQAQQVRAEMVRLFGELKTKEIVARAKVAAQRKTGVVLANKSIATGGKVVDINAIEEESSEQVELPPRKVNNEKQEDKVVEQENLEVEGKVEEQAETIAEPKTETPEQEKVEIEQPKEPTKKEKQKKELQNEVEEGYEPGM